jgi:hypothetical protein
LNLSSRLGETLWEKTKGLKQNTMLENKVKKSIKLCQNNAELTNLKHSSLTLFYREFRGPRVDKLPPLTTLITHNKPELNMNVFGFKSCDF